MADSISADLPRDRVKALAAVIRDSRGAFLAGRRQRDPGGDPYSRDCRVRCVLLNLLLQRRLPDYGRLSRTEDSWASPTGLWWISTGSGLKDISAVMKGVEIGWPCALSIFAPDPSSLDQLANSLNATRTDDD